MTRALIGLLVLVVLAAVVWLAVALVHRGAGGGGGGGPGGFGGRGGRPSTTVGVATATRADVPITIDALGTVTPAATVTVSPQVTGMITQILFTEGQLVRAGQPLAIIDPRPLQNTLTQSEGQLARDQAQLAAARLLLQRQQILLAQDSIARQDVDTQAALVRQLEGTVTSDRGAVSQARLNLGFSRVTAPVSGRVGLRVVDVGNFISAGSATGIAVVTQVTPIDVAFTLPQDDVPRVQAQAAKGRLPVIAFDRTRTIQLDEGVFSTLDNQIDTTTGTIRAKARFPNGAGKLFPNQFVNVRLNIQTLTGAVVVPVTAVRTASDGDFVWKLNDDKTVTRVKVTRGPGAAETTSITSGLTVGERVITEGGDRLTDGTTVTLPGDKPQAGGGFNRAAMQAARKEMQKSCAADIKSLCADKKGREIQACLRENADSVSAPCKAAMAKMPRRGGGGGQGGAQPQVQSQAPVPAPAQTTTTTTTTTTRPPAAAAPAAAPQAQGGQGGGQGGGFRSPEMMAARQAMMKTCATDAAKACPGLEGREMMMCLREKSDSLSGPCKDAMAKMPRRRPQGGGEGGG